MSETTVDAVDHEAHEHPSDWQYVKIAALLAIFTAIEVLTYFESVFTIFENRAFLLFSLFFLMIVKFWLVGAYFMHLKNDKPILRQSFVAGIVLATAVYIITLLAFNFFG